MNTLTQSYATIAPIDVTQKTADALTAHGFEPIFIETGKEAFETLKTLIPEGASIMNGSSRTLEEIGFVEHLKAGTHGWKNLHAEVLQEKDLAKQAELRKHAVVSDFYIGSAHAVTEEGEIVIFSHTGSQMPHLVYTSQNIILVVGRQKIVPNLHGAFTRLNEYIIALEDENMQKKYGMNTMHSKTVILHKENPMLGRNIKVLLVNEKLGF